MLAEICGSGEGLGQGHVIGILCACLSTGQTLISGPGFLCWPTWVCMFPQPSDGSLQPQRKCGEKIG